jgi:hypothetical protein
MKKHKITVEKYHLVLRERSFLDCQENNNRPSAYKLIRIPKYRIMAGKKVLAEYFDTKKEAQEALKRDWTVEGCEQQSINAKLAHLERIAFSHRECQDELKKLKDRKIRIEIL